MNTKIISPKTHALADYALASSLLIVPRVFDFPKTVQHIYTVEALTLLSYIAITEQPAAIKPVIPFKVHGKIDPFNIAQFALQSFLKPFRKDKKALLFNIGFTIAAGIVVTFTDWKGKTK